MALRTLCNQARLLRWTRGTLTGPQSAARQFSDNKKGDDAQPAAGPVYELRMYSIKPEKFGTFRQLMADRFHLRLAYSMPLGYWIADLGGIFQAVHIWPYESVGQRNEIRQAMAGDKKWTEGFLAHFLPCTLRMDNVLTTLIGPPGTKPCTDFTPSPTAAYELVALRGTTESDLPSASSSGDSGETLVGRFRGVYGDVNMEWRLMRYPDADTAFVHARKRSEDNPDLFAFSRFMVPHECSPIK